MSVVLILGLFVFITGICIGSFLNVVILRAFSNESISYPASKCPKCQTPLKWYHNIPLFSYAFLKGHCAFCKEKISIQYPIIELITGIIFVIIFFRFGFSLETIMMWFLCSIMLVLSVTDLKEKVIFDKHAYFLIGGGLIFNLLNLNPVYQKFITFPFAINFSVNASFIASILGIIVGIAVMEILARTGYLLAGTRAFGEGDTYIAAGLGAIFGWKISVFVLLLAIILQLIVTIPMFLIKLFKEKDFLTILLSLIFVIAIYITKIQVPYSEILLLISGIVLCIRILKGLKKDSDFMYLPFGPAMLLAGFMFILL